MKSTSLLDVGGPTNEKSVGGARGLNASRLNVSTVIIDSLAVEPLQGPLGATLFHDKAAAARLACITVRLVDSKATERWVASGVNVQQI